MAVLVNGLVLKDPKLVQAHDVFIAGLDNQDNKTDLVESFVAPVNMTHTPELWATRGCPIDYCTI